MVTSFVAPVVVTEAGPNPDLNPGHIYNKTIIIFHTNTEQGKIKKNIFYEKVPQVVEMVLVSIPKTGS
ncbi:hypothetical protein OUZ56_006453 [Daphnia magna]|uniref:Uncharacterized protein n=1 Tax=Daphnia magna TaxID=35525 RepID=A0ABQ9YVQ6_9CRUS|nr:hypothetical protein OUZ56_006453 [Daphnia magna]